LSKFDILFTQKSYSFRVWVWQVFYVI